MSNAEFLGRCKGCPIAGPACENVKNRRQAAKEAAGLASKGLEQYSQKFEGNALDVAGRYPDRNQIMSRIKERIDGSH